MLFTLHLRATMNLCHASRELTLQVGGQFSHSKTSHRKLCFRNSRATLLFLILSTLISCDIAKPLTHLEVVSDNLLTNISSSLSFMISIVYWSVLYNPERNELDFENFSGHLLIAVVHFIDVIIGDR